jgi:nucleoside phosphorylase
LSAKFNLVCDQATTFNFQFQILNNETPWNLTGYTGTMTVRPFVGASTTTVVASTANGRMVLTALQGRINVTLSAAITADIVAGRYSYDLVLNSGSSITRILEGKFIVTGAVTT